MWRTYGPVQLYPTIRKALIEVLKSGQQSNYILQLGQQVLCSSFCFADLLERGTQY